MVGRRGNGRSDYTPYLGILERRRAYRLYPYLTPTPIPFRYSPTPTSSITPTPYAPTATPAAFLLLHLYCNPYAQLGAEEIAEL